MYTCHSDTIFQVERFLDQFKNIGGKFKLVLFSDLAAQFSRDTTLSFARASVIASLRSSLYGKDIEVCGFNNSVYCQTKLMCAVLFIFVCLIIDERY